MKLLLTTVAIVALVCGSTRAADIPVYKAPPPAAPAWSWTGFYIGVDAGYGWGHDDFTEQQFSNVTLLVDPPFAALSGIDSKGGVWGGHFGYNWQMGAFVGGIEADLTSTNIKGSTSNTATNTIVSRDLTETLTDTRSRDDKFDWLGTVRGRVGWLAWPNVLFYGTGGLAWTRFVQGFSETQTATDVETRGGVTTFSSVSQFASSTPTTEFGWVVGAGVEAAVYYGWILGVEYLHYDFGDQGSSSQRQSV